MVSCNVGDFGRFKFIERYKNGKIYKRYYDLYGTVIEVGDGEITLRDNDTRHPYKVLIKDIEFFNREEKRKLI